MKKPFPTTKNQLRYTFGVLTIKSVRLDQGPRLNDLELLGVLVVFLSNGSHWHPNDSLVMHHLVELCNFQYFSPFWIFLLLCGKGIDVAVRDQASQIREMLEAPLCCVSLERAPRNDEERVLKVVAWQSAVDVLAASAEHEPIQQLRHFCVAASVNTCGSEL